MLVARAAPRRRAMLLSGFGLTWVLIAGTVLGLGSIAAVVALIVLVVRRHPEPRTAQAHPPTLAPTPMGAVVAASALVEPGGAANRPPPPAIADLQPEFPALEILELIGQGGMGAVYRVR